MKKTGFILIAFIALATVALAQHPTNIINNVLKKSADDKVERMQQLIGFDDAQANQLKTLEYTFLLDVRKAEKCCFCNKKKRVEKLKTKRATDLQKILTREQFIKYDAVENERIKKHPLWAE